MHGWSCCKTGGRRLERGHGPFHADCLRRMCAAARPKRQVSNLQGDRFSILDTKHQDGLGPKVAVFCLGQAKWHDNRTSESSGCTRGPARECRHARRSNDAAPPDVAESEPASASVASPPEASAAVDGPTPVPAGAASGSCS